MNKSNLQKPESHPRTIKPHPISMVIGNQSYLLEMNREHALIQRYKLMTSTFIGEEYSWTEEEKEKVMEGYGLALRQLEAAIAHLSTINSKKASALKLAAQRVQAVLMNKTLEVYPLMSDSGYLGLSTYGARQISINIGPNYISIAKTFIHEAFHIIGGWFDTTEDPAVLRADEPYCGDHVPLDTAYNALKGTDISYMSPDYFAQFVMKCE